MKNKILIVGFACLSLAAVAQSNGDKKQDPTPAPAASPRDAATGQASGKRMHKPLTVTAETSLDGTSKDAGKAPKGVETVQADFADKSSLRTALQGIESVYLVCGPVPQLVELEGNMIDACKEGLRRIKDPLLAGAVAQLVFVGDVRERREDCGRHQAVGQVLQKRKRHQDG